MMHIILTLLVIWACYAVFGAKGFAKLILGTLTVIIIAFGVLFAIEFSKHTKVDNFDDFATYDPSQDYSAFTKVTPPTVSAVICRKIDEFEQYIEVKNDNDREIKELALACIKANYPFKNPLDELLK